MIDQASCVTVSFPVSLSLPVAADGKNNNVRHKNILDFLLVNRQANYVGPIHFCCQ